MFRTIKNEKGEEKDFAVFIIHGNSVERNKIKDFISTQLRFRTIISIDEFKGGSVLEKIKKTIWNVCDCAVAIVSADEELNDGRTIPRQNVIFEIGYCLGYWDCYYWNHEELEPVVLIKEDSVVLNSDLLGIEYLEYRKDNIEAVYKKLSAALERIYERLGGSKKLSDPLEMQSASNDIRIIEGYLNDKKITFISFEKIKENIHSKFTESYLMRLIELMPDKIRRAKLKGGKMGIKLIGSN